MSNCSVRRILQNYLSFHSYKIILAQEITSFDYVSRLNLCQNILNRISETSTFLNADEAHFHLTSVVNKQNCQYWLTLTHGNSMINLFIHQKLLFGALYSNLRSLNLIQENNCVMLYFHAKSFLSLDYRS